MKKKQQIFASLAILLVGLGILPVSYHPGQDFRNIGYSFAGSSPFQSSTTPDFTITANPSNLTIRAGAVGDSVITVASVNGFSGEVSLLVTPSPPLCPQPGCSTWAVSPTSVSVSPTRTGTATLGIFAGTAFPGPGKSIGIAVNGTSVSLNHSVDVVFTTISASAPDFSLNANPTSLTIVAGSLGHSVISLQSINNFKGTVSLSRSPPPLCPQPQCSTWTVSPTTVTLGPNQTTTATLSIYGGTAGGSDNIIVSGTSGSLSHSTEVTFTVATPDFTLTANPATQSVPTGSLASFIITVKGTNGFNNTVSLTATTSPVTKHGPTTSLPSTVGPYSTSTLTVSTSRNTPLGTYSVTVTAISGSLTHTISVGLVVTR